MYLKKTISTCILFLCMLLQTHACTIFSGMDKKGHMWAGNNEDNLFSFNTYLTLSQHTDSTFGYFYFTNSGSPDEYIQGGMNDAGLFYDGNSVPPSVYKDFDKKKDFPGGHRAMIQFVLGKCKTVQDVLKLFTEYRLPGNEGGQLHFADKYGNMGIIVADSMWINKTSFQVSTNYNLCHANKDGETCWRYPIAERILKSEEASLDSFRKICDSTSQKNVSSTIYSNIQNLNTGDVWFYYAMDYKNPVHFTIADLLKKGNTSFPLYELFSKTPLVNVYNTYKKSGIESALKKLDEYKLPNADKNLALRLLYFDLISYNHDFKSYPPLYAAVKANLSPTYNEADELLKVQNTLALFCTGNKAEALLLLNNFKAQQPENNWIDFITYFSDQMQGKFEKEANVTFELNAFPDAKSVFVEGIDQPNFIYFLIQQNGKWIGKFKMDPDEYHYYFLVDGKKILDPANKDVINVGGVDYNRLIVK